MPETPRTPPVLLDEVEGIRLFHWPGEGPASLAVFAPGREGHAGPREWWGYPIAARLGWNTVAFATSRQNWYPRTAMEHLLPRALEALGAQPVVTYGFSMGGYAALKYGRALGARGTLALSPQYSIDPAEVPGDPRAAHFFDSRLHGGMAVQGDDVAGLAFYAYDPIETQDRQHADRLARVPGLRAVQLRRAGHATPAVLAEAHSAPAILTAIAAGDAAAAVAGMRAARRGSASLLTALALTLEFRGHRGWADRIWARLPEEHTQPQRLLAARARVLHQLGRYAEELPLLKAWIAEEPVSLEAHLCHATCCLALNQPTAAVAAIRDAMALGKVDQRMHAALVSCLKRLRRQDEAIAAARAAARAEPGMASAQLLLGDTLLWAGRPAFARKAFAAALALDPQGASAQRGLAVLEPAVGQGPGPLFSGLLTRLVRSRAAEEEWLAVAEQLLLLKRVAAAAIVLRRGIRVQPASRRLRLRLCTVLSDAGRSDKALEAFLALARHAPEMQEGWIGASDMLWRLQRITEGVALLAEAVAAHPGHAGLALRHATFLNAAGDAAGAEREALRALVLRPDDENGLLTVADAMWRQQRAPDAAAFIEKACARLPGSTTLAARHGHLLLALGAPDRAAEAFERAVAKDPAPAHAWAGLTDALWQANRLADAAEAARRGIAQHGDSAELKARLGQILLALGDAEAARDTLSEAAAATPEGSDVQIALADALWRQGRRAEALAAIRSAAAALPGRTDVQARLGHLLVELGHIEEAASVFEQLTRDAPNLATAWAGLCEVERQRKRLKQAIAACRRAEQEGADRETIRILRFRLFGELEGA